MEIYILKRASMAWAATEEDWLLQTPHRIEVVRIPGSDFSLKNELGCLPISDE